MKVCEFFSGIGGMGFALRSAGVVVDEAKSVAVDINTSANDVFRHNFPSVKVFQRGIESISIEQLDDLNSDIWTMSPPCQPYTRQGNVLADRDPRSSSFFYLLEGIVNF